ncbi:MAG: hypothetical protein AAGK09_03295 [Planctomycetota bacterium]
MIEDTALIPRLKAALATLALTYVTSLAVLGWLVLQTVPWWQSLRLMLCVAVWSAVVALLCAAAAAWLVNAWLDLMGGSVLCKHCGRTLCQGEECLCRGAVAFRDRLKTGLEVQAEAPAVAR